MTAEGVCSSINLFKNLTRLGLTVWRYSSREANWGTNSAGSVAKTSEKSRLSSCTDSSIPPKFTASQAMRLLCSGSPNMIQSSQLLGRKPRGMGIGHVIEHYNNIPTGDRSELLIAQASRPSSVFQSAPWQGPRVLPRSQR